MKPDTLKGQCNTHQVRPEERNLIVPSPWTFDVDFLRQLQVVYVASGIVWVHRWGGTGTIWEGGGGTDRKMKFKIYNGPNQGEVCEV